MLQGMPSAYPSVGIWPTDGPSVSPSTLEPTHLPTLEHISIEGAQHFSNDGAQQIADYQAKQMPNLSPTPGPSGLSTERPSESPTLEPMSGSFICSMLHGTPSADLSFSNWPTDGGPIPLG